MKEIFNDIRSKISMCSDEACFMPDNTMVVSENRIKHILDEAESDMRKHDIEVRNKAIDEFAEKLKTNSRLGYIGYLDTVVNEIAQQLKEE